MGVAGRKRRGRNPTAGKFRTQTPQDIVEGPIDAPQGGGERSVYDWKSRMSAHRRDGEGDTQE